MNNFIENKLKINDKYINIDHLTNDNIKPFINNEIIKEFRNKTQCFRHQTIQHIQQANNYKDYEKICMINIGYAICIFLHDLLDKDNND